MKKAVDSCKQLFAIFSKIRFFSFNFINLFSTERLLSKFLFEHE